MSTRFFINDQLSAHIIEPDQYAQVPNDYILTQINDITQSITENKPPNDENGHIYEIYQGYAGIAYMFYHLSKSRYTGLSEKQGDLLNLGRDYIKFALEIAEKTQQSVVYQPSFLLGNGGVYAVATVIYHALKDIENSMKYQNLFYDTANTCKDFRFLSCGSDELFVGRAGFLCAALFIAKETGMPLRTSHISDICNVMLTSGRKYSDQNKDKIACPLMYTYYNVEYLGAGHGLSSILLMLLSVPNLFKNDAKLEEQLKASVDFVLNLQDSESNFPCRVGEKDETNDLIHWCHGAGGIIYLMAKAYLTWPEEKYLNSCIAIGQLIWEKGLLRKGPGLCHGIAGNAYVFLLLYRLTGNEVHLDRAIWFARFLNDSVFKNESRIPDNPYSLFEGIAGTACFLGDLLDPQHSNFPFFDVFT